MDSLIQIQRKLLPELVPIMQRRFDILQYIGTLEPVGRRSLAQSVGLTERILRSEVTILKEQNLITISHNGMSLTKDGREVLEGLREVIREVTSITSLEQMLQRKLNVQRVMIVSGNSDENEIVKRELGKACAQCMKELATGKHIIAVTGGTTMAAVADMLTPDIGTDLLFVPARGGIGEDVQNQANSIVAKMAKNTASQHKVLYVPDAVSKEMYATIVKEPSIEEVLQLIKSATIVLHGIGDAITMARRRKTDEWQIENLIEKGAVSEAFGYYFDAEGKVVHKISTIGLQLDDLQNSQYVLAVAGGSSKGRAIYSYMKQAPSNTILITDEGAVREILKENE